MSVSETKNTVLELSLHSGLDRNVFSVNEQELIARLIKEDLWIEEETNVLKDMYYQNLNDIR